MLVSGIDVNIVINIVVMEDLVDVWMLYFERICNLFVEEVFEFFC